jgi:hypothetical protein
MPEPIWTYLTALLYFPGVSTCLAMAQAFDHPSHDRLTRMLRGPWSGQTRLDLALRALFPGVGGSLIVDDTIVEKPYAALLEEGAWVGSTKHNQVVFGIPVVLLVWTNGQVRIPLAFRVWKKGGPSKFDLAWELLSYARNHLRCKPQVVLFDAWYPAKKLLKRLQDYGWYFVCQLKKTGGSPAPSRGLVSGGLLDVGARAHRPRDHPLSAQTTTPRQGAKERLAFPGACEKSCVTTDPGYGLISWLGLRGRGPPRDWP